MGGGQCLSFLQAANPMDHPTFYPRIILSDFERFSINAFQISFPLAKQHGCFVSFCANCGKRYYLNFKINLILNKIYLYSYLHLQTQFTDSKE